MALHGPKMTHRDLQHGLCNRQRWPPDSNSIGQKPSKNHWEIKIFAFALHRDTKMAAKMPKMTTKSPKMAPRTKTALQMPKTAPKISRIGGPNLQDSPNMASKMVPKMSLDGQSSPQDGLATDRQAKLKGAAVIPGGMVNKDLQIKT